EFFTRSKPTIRAYRRRAEELLGTRRVDPRKDSDDRYEAKARAKTQAKVPSHAADRAAASETIEGGADGEATRQATAKATAGKALDDWSAHVAYKAERAGTYDITAGEWVTQYWSEHGLRSEFPDGPLQMVEEAILFWWEERDRISILHRVIEELHAENEGLRERLRPGEQARETWNSIRDITLLAAMSGAQLAPESISALHESARAARLV
ncbi:MAG: hypothetical protein ACREC5_01795, partial [Thermoplasmata archaeon]